MRIQFLRLGLLILPLAFWPGALSLSGESGPPRKVFAHYMGNYPVGAAATAHHRAHDAHRVRHDSDDRLSALGGNWRNWDLVPPGTRLSREASADLEIRRALRTGIDGFAVDAWAGGEDAKLMLEALFRVAEEKDYPFEITICLDPNCLGSSSNAGKWGPEFQAHVDAVRLLLDRHGDSAKLARRDGRPLIFGYQSVWLGLQYAQRAVDWEIPWDDARLRATPEAWRRIAAGYAELQKEVGSPLFLHFCTSAFFHGVEGESISDEALEEAASALAEHFPAVGDFLGGGRRWDRMAEAVRAKGAEWSEPLWYQYESVQNGALKTGPGLEILRERWERARENNSTLIQFTTWNDYTESTNLAPGYNTRYTPLDLTAYFIEWWKTGREPTPTHDRIYLAYRKYPRGARVYPFKDGVSDSSGVLEVITILPRPGLIRLPGRNIQYVAPSGLHAKQFPLMGGPVVAELTRSGKVDVRLESPEPITTMPFRTDNGTVCFSTEFERHWRADFGDTPPFLYSEYGDVDRDGLPNWFEMYWFGKFLDPRTAASAEPEGDPDGNGITNLQAFLAQQPPR